MVRRDKEVADVYHQAVADFAVNLQTALLSIGHLTGSLHRAVTHGRELAFRNICNHGDGLIAAKPQQIRSRVRRLNTEGCDASAEKWELVQGIRSVERAIPNTGEGKVASCGAIRSGRHANKRCRPLWMRDEEETNVVAVAEEPEPGANDRVFVRRIRQPHSGLEGLVEVVHRTAESGLIIPAHSIVQREFGSDPPLVLGEKA